MNKQKIYCISGLGADYRAFQFLDLPNYELVHLDWLDPYEKESLQAYAQRMAAKITCKYPILMGLSFGGIVANTIAQFLPYKHIILLASVQCRTALPPYFRMCKYLPLHQLAPSAVFQTPNALLKWLFSAQQVNEVLFSSIISDTNPKFAKWAIHEIVNWGQAQPLAQTTAIHGAQDKIFPIRYIHNAHILPDAGHLMTLTHPKEVAQIIIETIEQISSK